MSDVPPPPPPPPPGGSMGDSNAAVSTADMGARFIAGLIDLVAIPMGIYIASRILGRIFFLFGFLAMLAFIGYWFYMAYTEGTTGQTIGKKMQAIKTVSADTGEPLGFAQAFVRYLLNGLVCGFGWLLALVDPQKQTLGDKVARGITIPA